MHSFSEHLVRFITKNRIAVILFTLLFTGIFGYYTTKIYVDNDAMKSVPETLREKLELKKLQETFYTPFVLLFMAEFEQGTLSEKIDSMSAWAARFESIVIDSARGITGTVHLGTVKTPVRGGFFGIQSGFVVPKGDDISDDVIRKNIADNSSLIKGLISDDEKILGMVLSINPDLNRPRVVEQAFKIHAQLDKYRTVKTYMTGEASMPFLISRAMKRDFSIMLPICLLVSSILLYLIFKSIRFTAASLIIIAISLVWTFGLLGMFGVPFSVVISIIPIIMFPVGVANSIHVLKTFARHRWQNGLDFTQSFTETYNELLRPIFLTSITTFFGFGSFVFSAISWTRYFGVFCGIGVMISLFLTILLLPAFASWEKKTTLYSDDSLNIPEHAGRSFAKLLFDTPFYKVLSAAVVVICVIGAFFVRYESNPIAMFSPKSEIRKSDALITKYFKGTSFFYIVLTHKTRSLADTARWEEVDSIIAFLKRDDVIGNVSSILPLLNRTSMILNNKPVSAAGISLLLKAKGMFGKSFGNLVDSWLTPDRSTMKLQVTCRNIPGYKYTRLARQIQDHITTRYPDWEVTIAGPAILIDAMITLLINTQVSSISSSFLAVFFILVLLFRSFKIGFFSIIPMFISTLLIYALMGLFHVPVNTVTVVIMNTCIGIGIDYSIHFTAGYLFIKGSCENNREALIKTINTKGSVILFNTIVVGAGFFILVFSSFPPIRSFGLFIFISMLISASFALIYLPVLYRSYTQHGISSNKESVTNV